MSMFTLSSDNFELQAVYVCVINKLHRQYREGELSHRHLTLRGKSHHIDLVRIESR